jgi:hypothetical protein
MTDDYEAQNKATDLFLYKIRAAREERERREPVIREISVPVTQRASDVLCNWAQQRIDEATSQLCERDMELAEEVLDIVAESMRRETKTLHLEINALKAEIGQLKAEQQRDRMIARGELTVLPPFLRKSTDVA